jgi:hypothetical protein
MTAPGMLGRVCALWRWQLMDINTNAVAANALKKVWRHKPAVSYHIFIDRAFLIKSERS